MRFFATRGWKRALGGRRGGLLLGALDEAEPVLELGDAKLKLLPLAARDEPELAHDAREAARRPLAPSCAPPRRASGR